MFEGYTTTTASHVGNHGHSAATSSLATPLGSIIGKPNIVRIVLSDSESEADGETM